MQENIENSKKSWNFFDKKEEYNKGLVIFFGVFLAIVTYLISVLVCFKAAKITLYVIYSCAIGLGLGGVFSWGVSKKSYIEKKYLSQ